MMKTISAILLSSAIWADCAEERNEYEYTYSDEAKKVTARVRDDGVVVPGSVTVDYAEPPPREKVTVYRLEVEGDKQFVVGADGVRRQVALMGADEYAQLAERVDAVWRIQNATPEGRRKLHGAVTNTVINAEQKRKEEYHTDGYVHYEPMQIRRSSPPPVVKLKADKRRNVSKLHAEMRRKLEERTKVKPKTVTVEHDAATGKDIVK